MADLPVRSPPPGPPVPGHDEIASLVPFGLGRDKPHHFLEMWEVLQENSDSLGYAWRILTRGVCDGCSLGPRGLRDDVIDGVHLCTTRLRLLRLNTMPALAPADLLDIERLRAMDNRSLAALGRLPYPFVYRRGDRGFRKATWEEALAIAGGALRETAPDRMAFFATSRGLTNEAYYAFTKAARLLGTNNVDLCARLCHQASVAGLKSTIGVGAPTCSLSDLIGTDLLLLFGTDIANNQPVSMKYLALAKERGTRVVVINPVLEKGLEAYWVPSLAVSAVFGTRLMDDFVQVNAGGDIAFVHGLVKTLVERGQTDEGWIARHTTGWEETRAAVLGLSWEEIERESGVPRSQIAWVAELFARARTCVSIWSMGLTQHRFGTQNVQAVVNLHLARGMIGRPKCGLLPIRGHSGVQGGGECGVSPTLFPGSRTVSAETAAEMSALWGGLSVPSGPGLSTGPMIEAAHSGAIDVLYNVGGNLLRTMPDPDFVREALGRVRVRIHQDIVVNDSALVEPGEWIVLLPAQTRYEQRGGGTSTSTERRIRFSPEIEGHPVVGECKPEWEIPALVAVAARAELATQLTWSDAGEIRREMGRTMPIYRGIETLEKAGDWVQWGGPILCKDGEFPAMPDGRARFSTLAIPRHEVPAGSFWLTTRRGKQFNSIVFDDADRVQGGRGRDDLFVNAVDLERLHISEGARVRVRSDTGEWTAVARPANIRPGVVQAYWPECNGLIARRWDPVSEEPDYNAVVTIEAV